MARALQLHSENPKCALLLISFVAFSAVVVLVVLHHALTSQLRMQCIVKNRHGCMNSKRMLAIAEKWILKKEESLQNEF